MKTLIGFASGTSTRSLTFISVRDNVGTARAAVKAKSRAPHPPRAIVTSSEVCWRFPSTEPMPLLDRCHTRPVWHHKDADVRATAVREIPTDQQDTLAEIARTDDDPRVRRAAVKRLTDAATLAQCVQADPDEGVRNEAME